MLILEHDPALSRLFWLDEFGNRVVMSRPPPWSGGNQSEFTEVDATELSAWLGSPDHYTMIVGIDQVMQAVEAAARRRKRHTLREWLSGLEWDGVPRVGRMFVDLFGADESTYVLGAGACFMVSAVSRVLWHDDAQPTKGSKVDFMVVLEGGQGAGKTTAVLDLFGADWYAEATESPAHKDFYQTLRGRWGIEIGEMDSFSKADVAKVKQAITTRTDVYRPSYGRTSKGFRRECVFIGTTNKDDYLRDETGARRFLPVRVKAVQLALIAQCRDQLWAEAVQLFRDGFQWWQLPPGAEREQADRFSEDVWTSRVERWVRGDAEVNAYDFLQSDEKDGTGAPLEFSIADVLTHALKIEPARQDRAASTRVGSILSFMGCQHYRPRSGGGSRLRRYFLPAAVPDA